LPLLISSGPAPVDQPQDLPLLISVRSCWSACGRAGLASPGGLECLAIAAIVTAHAVRLGSGRPGRTSCISCTSWPGQPGGARLVGPEPGRRAI